MIYKLANDTDMYSLPPMDEKTWDTLFEFTKILSCFGYGQPSHRSNNEHFVLASDSLSEMR